MSIEWKPIIPSGAGWPRKQPEGGVTIHHQFVVEDLTVSPYRISLSNAVKATTP